MTDEERRLAVYWQRRAEACARARRTILLLREKGAPLTATILGHEAANCASNAREIMGIDE